MKILWLNSNVLFPLNRGGNIRTFNILRELNRKHNVTYLSYLDDSRMDEEEIKVKMNPCCDELIYVKKRWERKFSPRFYMSLLKNLFSPYPYVISKYYDEEMAELVSSTLAGNSFDAIICDFLFTSAFLPAEHRSRAILFQHNIESLIWERHCGEQTNPLKKGYFYLQWQKLLRYEKGICPEFKACITVSEEDDRIISGFGVTSSRVIPTGVDTDYFSPADAAERPLNLVFTGSMDWLPNEDAIIYFFESIYPRIKRAVPEVTLTVVGRDPSARIRALERKDPSVEVTGTVKDVRPYISSAPVYIVPIRIGGGTRLKIFEAMSMRKAIVSTPVGAEGLPFNDGGDILIAPDERSFADLTVELLKNPEMRRRIGEAARSLVVEKYDWSTVAKRFEEICSEFSCPSQPYT